eukprot:TRINITY_DN627_c0_g3_i1.p1 TRINITY_DN627_c0_g3~~TRINITY_DN627_c0_g3_i1.p1  ORF type:complete len:302 (+),score=60.44 TRINITY_DN627_c0_g3_i1:40-906(+)
MNNFMKLVRDRDLLEDYALCEEAVYYLKHGKVMHKVAQPVPAKPVISAKKRKRTTSSSSSSYSSSVALPPPPPPQASMIPIPHEGPSMPSNFKPRTSTMPQMQIKMNPVIKINMGNPQSQEATTGKQGKMVGSVFREASDDSEEDNGKRQALPKPVVTRTPEKKAPPKVVEKEDNRRKELPKKVDKKTAQLIASLPQDRTGLYTYPLNWELITEDTYTTIRPWLNKRVTDILGAEEPSFVDYVISKIKARERPQSIEEDLKDALDDDATKFVMQMWRFLIFETVRHNN